MSSGDFNETYISLRFDDGWKSQLNAYELLKKYNLTGSIYIVSDFMGKEGYMNWKDVEMINDTMEIGGHTKTHADLRIVPNYEEEIVENYNELKNRGFNPKTFVYPYGNYNSDSLKVVKKYYICASTQDVGVNNKKTDKYLLRDFTLRKDNDIEDVKGAIKNNTWIILTFHDVGEPSSNAPTAVKNNAVSVEFFEEILKYIKENNIKVIKIEEGCELLLK